MDDLCVGWCPPIRNMLRDSDELVVVFRVLAPTTETKKKRQWNFIYLGMGRMNQPQWMRETSGVGYAQLSLII